MVRGSFDILHRCSGRHSLLSVTRMVHTICSVELRVCTLVIFSWQEMHGNRVVVLQLVHDLCAYCNCMLFVVVCSRCG